MDPNDSQWFAITRLSATRIAGSSQREYSAQHAKRRSLKQQTGITVFQQWIKNLQASGPATNTDSVRWVERVSAVLLIEIARSDAQIDAAELDAIHRALLAGSPSMTADDIHQITESAVQQAELTISLHEQIRQINDGFTREQKISLVEQMWRVAFADGDLDKYEEHTIRKLCGLIYVNHREFIQAKLKVTGS